MSKGRQIKIYLADGSVTGIRHAEIMGWTGQALTVPRSKVKELSDWEECINYIGHPSFENNFKKR